MERRTLWRGNVVTATRTRDGRKQSHHGMGSSGSAAGRNVQRNHKQSFVFQYPTGGPSRPTSSLSQRTRPSLKADKHPPRAHSSLGFAWSSRSVSKPELSRPRGFDLARYVQKQGSATAIRIGVNGEATNDDYFRNYLKECEKQLENASASSFDDESTSDLEGDIFEGISISQGRRENLKHVPLCWEDQFQKAEPNMIKTAGKKTTARNSSSPTCPTVPQRPTSNSGGEPESLIAQSLQDLSVMLSWGEVCVLNWTAVKDINTVTVPQTTHSEDNSPVNQCGFEATVGDPYTDTSTLPLQLVAADHDGCNKAIPNLVPLLSSLPDVSDKDIGNSNLLCIWFKPSAGGTSFAAGVNCKDLTFDVFVTFTGSSTVAFTKEKCRDTSGGLLAIVVNLDGRFVRQDQFVRQLAPCIGQEVKISLTCHKPRRLLFSTKAMSPVYIRTSSALPPIPSQPGAPSGDEENACPETFFERRRSYCNQEDDEDRTDIRALVCHYPDLQVLDLNNPTTTPLLLHHELTSSTHHTQRTVVAGAHPTIQLSPPPTIQLSPPPTIQLSRPPTIQLSPPPTIQLSRPPPTIQLSRPPPTIWHSPPPTPTIQLSPPPTPTIQLSPPPTIRHSPPPTPNQLSSPPTIRHSPPPTPTTHLSPPPTIQHSPPPTPIPSTNRSIFRPPCKPHPTAGYVAIVKQWLTPYTKDLS